LRFGFARHRRVKFGFSDLTQSGRFGTDLPFEKLWVNSQKMVKNWYFFVFFCKKRALFVIFCAIFVLFAIFLTILGSFGVAVT